MMKPIVVMHKRTGELKEMTRTFMGLVIWMMEFDNMPHGTICTWPYVIYDDDKRFNDYEVIGEI